LPLLPFVDFMLCLVAFLLATAIWSQMARLTAVGTGQHGGDETLLPKTTLHVSVQEQSFALAWREGSTLIETQQVPRKAVFASDHAPHYPALGAALGAAWAAHGVHRAASDASQDLAVLHTSNALDFGEVAAVMDALHAPRRKLDGAPRDGQIAAFAVSFAVD
jgi:biopolymer transport protein ExbD